MIIEQELPYIVAKRKYEETPVLGSNRILHEWFEDYEPYDLEISNVSIPYENLAKVKRWLLGESTLITHNDPDKYCHAVCNMSKEQPYQNELGIFYTFSIVFRCDPLKYRVNEPEIKLKHGANFVTNHGDDKSAPFFEFESSGGDITLECNEYKLTIMNTGKGKVTVDTELAMCVQNNIQLRTKGKWMRVSPGNQTIKVTGNNISGKIQMRGVYL
nr:phage tail protein [Enterococcus plantarum]